MITLKPDISIVIPVYNEEAILRGAAEGLISELKEAGRPFEVIFSENGSNDGTLEELSRLHDANPEVKFLSTGEPNYGLAMRKGIVQAEGAYVICDEIDICDSGFHKSAVEILEGGRYDLVIGSKLAEGARDKRPFFRHLATLVMNFLLRLLLGFKGTDTHGLKAFNRDHLMPVVNACKVDKDLFASEFVIRAERMGIKIKEIPVSIMEKRKPSINLLKRVPNVLKNLAKLFYIIRIKG